MSFFPPPQKKKFGIRDNKMPVLNESPIFMLDNGGGCLKAGYSNQKQCRLMPNAITKAKSEKRRAFVGDQMDDCRDLSGLFFMLPFQKGYLVNWDQQKTIWDYLFKNMDPSSHHLIFTEPYFNFTSIKEGLSEMLFEEFQFASVLRTHAGDLSCYKNKTEQPAELCCLVVDTGYSFTHIVPFVRGKRVKEAIKRIDVGGKLLTNHLKEIMSYRQIHVLDETYVMNACKEDSCFVTLDYDEDMKTAYKESQVPPRKASQYNFKLARDYVLPDFTSIRRGYMKPATETGRVEEGSNEQTIRLNNERFCVPELLFRPSDVGIDQVGIPEAIVDAISHCDADAQPWLYRNIVVTGGNAAIPNMRERIEREVRAMAPDVYDVIVRLPANPVSYAWSGGAALAKDPCLKEMSVTRDEYMERGHSVCQERYFL